MKKIFFVVIMLSSIYTHAQDLENGNFVDFCGTTNPIECWPHLDYFNNPCMSNWFRTNGAPSTGSIGPNSISLIPQVGPAMVMWHPVTSAAGSQGVAASYMFLKEHCYKVTLQIAVTEPCSGTTLTVRAVSGLSQTPEPPPCLSAPPAMTPTDQLIGTFTASPLENDIRTITFTFTAANDNSQILIFVNNDVWCDWTSIELPGELFPMAPTISLRNVSITSCNDCDNVIFKANKSSLISAGGVIQHSVIKAGSSVAPGGDPIVNAAADKNTLLLASWVKFEEKFKAVVNQGKFFIALPTVSCPCTLETNIWAETFNVCIGENIHLLNATPGGIWSGSNNDRATVDPVSGWVHGISTIGGSGDVDITYTLGRCSTTQRIHVISCPPPGGKSSDTTRNQGIKKYISFDDGLQIYPNPTQNTITVLYPCKSAGQLEIGIKDVANRIRYTESVACKEDSNVQHIIDMSTLPAGVYFVELTYNGEHTVKKVVKL